MAWRCESLDIDWSEVQPLRWWCPCYGSQDLPARSAHLVPGGSADPWQVSAVLPAAPVVGHRGSVGDRPGGSRLDSTI
jgi:hypothetical protein